MSAINMPWEILFSPTNSWWPRRNRNCHPFRSICVHPPVFSGVRVSRSLVLCVCFVDRCLFFCTFLLTIVLSVLLRFTDSDYLPLISINSVAATGKLLNKAFPVDKLKPSLCNCYSRRHDLINRCGDSEFTLGFNGICQLLNLQISV
jgi:hypothetical protein